MRPDQSQQSLDPELQNIFSGAALFEWKTEYSVGIATLDMHHKRMFDLVNALHEAMLQQQGRSVLAATLDGLIRYTQVHFNSEEVLMEVFAYPGLLEHRVEHDRLSRTVQAFQEQFLHGQAQLTVQLMEFLKTWLVNHLLVSDQKYVDYFTSCRPKQ
jgi:hemerythrin-like metal-binding protein